MGRNFQRTLKLSMSFSLKHFFISVAISTQVVSAPLNTHFYKSPAYQQPKIYRKTYNRLSGFSALTIKQL